MIILLYSSWWNFSEVKSSTTPERRDKGRARGWSTTYVIRNVIGCFGSSGLGDFGEWTRFSTKNYTQESKICQLGLKSVISKQYLTVMSNVSCGPFLELPPQAYLIVIRTHSICSGKWMRKLTLKLIKNPLCLEHCIFSKLLTVQVSFSGLK